MPPFLNDVTIGQVAIIFGLGVMIVGSVMKAWPWLSRLKNTIDDWMGEPERPGVKARPGLMKRMADQEDRDAARDKREAERDAREAERDKAVELLRPVVADISAKVERIDYHSRPNGGGSAHDAIVREVKGVRADLADHVKQAASIHEEQAAAIAYLAGDITAIDDLAAAVGPAIRSTPHECDLPPTDDDDTPGP